MKTDSRPPIVCFTDFSKNATEVGLAAAALSLQWERPLTLVHVFDQSVMAIHSMAGYEELRQQAQGRLDAEARRIGGTGIPVARQLLADPLPAAAISTWIEKNPAGLVVLSAVSKTAFDRWTLGSVSEIVAQSVAAPALIVRSAAPFEQWAYDGKPLRIFVAADFTESSEAALQWVRTLREAGPCEVTVGLVDLPEQERQRLGLSGPPNYWRNTPEVQQRLEADLAEKVAAVLGTNDAHIRVRGSCGQPDAHLIELACAAEADLLVVGSHQRHGVERLVHHSTSRNILRHAPMSVACVPATAVARSGQTIPACRRVLAPVALDGEGSLALPNAYSIVSGGGTVKVLHVTSRQDRAELAAKVCALVPSEAAARGIKTTVEVVAGDDVAAAICQAAEAMNADAVCIGAHTRPGAIASVMGSVTHEVLQRCRRPVMVVWPPEA